MSDTPRQRYAVGALAGIVSPAVFGTVGVAIATVFGGA